MHTNRFVQWLRIAVALALWIIVCALLLLCRWFWNVSESDKCAISTKYGASGYITSSYHYTFLTEYCFLVRNIKWGEMSGKWGTCRVRACSGPHRADPSPITETWHPPSEQNPSTDFWNRPLPFYSAPCSGPLIASSSANCSTAASSYPGRQPLVPPLDSPTRGYTHPLAHIRTC